MLLLINLRSDSTMPWNRILQINIDLNANQLTKCFSKRLLGEELSFSNLKVEYQRNNELIDTIQISD